VGLGEADPRIDDEDWGGQVRHEHEYPDEFQVQ
jgi:hypothetical protein